MTSIKVKYLKTFRQASIGLLPAVKAYPVYFKTRFGIHTFFMKFPIDVLILDSNNRVVNLKENLNPFRIFLWNPKFSTVIELPEGSINRLNIKRNSKVLITYEKDFQ